METTNIIAIYGRILACTRLATILADRFCIVFFKSQIAIAAICFQRDTGFLFHLILFSQRLGDRVLDR